MQHPLMPRHGTMAAARWVAGMLLLLLRTRLGHVQGAARPDWAVRILSPFPFEPLEPEEVEVSVDLSALPVPCAVAIVLNGHRVAVYIREVADAQNAEWTWRPDEHLLRTLDGFNGLEVEARMAVCADGAELEQTCRADDDSGVIARAEADFELVRFTKLRYSGACPHDHAGARGSPNVTQDELREVLKGRRGATGSMLRVLAPMVARRLHAHQHRGRHCPIARFVLWNSFGVHGFGSQLQSLRIGLEYGIRTNRIVVQNPEFEARIVQADLKLRFDEHRGDAAAAAPGGWGTGGLYWDNLESDEGQLHKMSQCDDHVIKWLSRSTYSPLTQWDAGDGPVLTLCLCVPLDLCVVSLSVSVSPFPRACVPACVPACVSACVSVCLCARVSACVRSCMHARMRACPRACVPVCLCACPRACLRVCMPACLPACMSACVQMVGRRCVHVACAHANV